jgi:hypothetical protein
MITIVKGSAQTKFTIHDVNFDNINDWDLFHESPSHSINSICSINSGVSPTDISQHELLA